MPVDFVNYSVPYDSMAWFTGRPDEDVVDPRAAITKSRRHSRGITGPAALRSFEYSIVINNAHMSSRVYVAQEEKPK